MLIVVPFLLLAQSPSDFAVDADVSHSQVEEDSIPYRASIIVFKTKEWTNGEIVKMTNQNVILKYGDGQLSIPMWDVFRIYPYSQDIKDAQKFLEDNPRYTYREIPPGLKSTKPKKLSKFRQRLYNVSYLSFLNKQRLLFRKDEGRASVINGLGTENITGYKFNQYFGLGLGVGMYNYLPNFLQRTDFNEFDNSFPQYSSLAVPLFLEVRGDLCSSNVRPYYSVGFGFTNVFLAAGERERWEDFLRTSNLDLNEFKLKPGMYFHPSLGVNIEAKSLNFMIDLGMQMAILNYQGINDSPFDFTCGNGMPCPLVFITTQEMIHRLVLRFGILL